MNGIHSLEATTSGAEILESTRSTYLHGEARGIYNSDDAKEDAPLDLAIMENKVPRPPNPWILYRSAKMHELKSALFYSHPTQASLSKVIAELWREESPQVKSYYNSLSDMKKKEHALIYPDYKFRPQSRVAKMEMREARRALKEQKRIEKVAAIEASRRANGHRKGRKGRKQQLPSNDRAPNDQGHDPPPQPNASATQSNQVHNPERQTWQIPTVVNAEVETQCSSSNNNPPRVNAFRVQTVSQSKPNNGLSALPTHRRAFSSAFRPSEPHSRARKAVITSPSHYEDAKLPQAALLQKSSHAPSLRTQTPWLESTSTALQTKCIPTPHTSTFPQSHLPNPIAAPAIQLLLPQAASETNQQTFRVASHSTIPAAELLTSHPYYNHSQSPQKEAVQHHIPPEPLMAPNFNETTSAFDGISIILPQDFATNFNPLFDFSQLGADWSFPQWGPDVGIPWNSGDPFNFDAFDLPGHEGQDQTQAQLVPQHQMQAEVSQQELDQWLNIPQVDWGATTNSAIPQHPHIIVDEGSGQHR